MSEDVAVYGRRGFALQPANIDEAMRMAEILSKSQMVPKAYLGKPQDVLVAMMMGCELGLNPIQSLQNIAVINGKPSIFGDALAALMLHHPAFGGMEETFDDAIMTATCTVWRKGGAKHTQTFSAEDASKAGLLNKPGPWTQYPKRMLQMRARGFAIRSQFADALAGLITREEAEDMPAERNITPAPNSVALEIPPPLMAPPMREQLEQLGTVSSEDASLSLTGRANPLASARLPTGQAGRPTSHAVEAEPQPAPTPAPPPKIMSVFHADGSVHSEHTGVRSWLAAFEALAASTEKKLCSEIIRQNALAIKAIDVRGVFSDRLNRVMDVLNGEPLPAAAPAEDEDVF